jgi:hypothetical protein
VTAIANEKGDVVGDRSSSPQAIKVFVAVQFARLGFLRPLSSSIPLWLDDASKGGSPWAKGEVALRRGQRVGHGVQ